MQSKNLTITISHIQILILWSKNISVLDIAVNYMHGFTSSGQEFRMSSARTSVECLLLSSVNGYTADKRFMVGAQSKGLQTMCSACAKSTLVKVVKRSLFGWMRMDVNECVTLWVFSLKALALIFHRCYSVVKNLLLQVNVWASLCWMNVSDTGLLLYSCQKFLSTHLKSEI